MTDDTERRYRITHTEPSYGGKTRRTHSTARAASVEVTDGLVRFLDSDGMDVFTINASRVVEYETRPIRTGTDDEGETEGDESTSVRVADLGEAFARTLGNATLKKQSEDGDE